MRWACDHEEHLEQSSFDHLLQLSSNQEIKIAEMFAPYPILGNLLPESQKKKMPKRKRLVWNSEDESEPEDAAHQEKVRKPLKTMFKVMLGPTPAYFMRREKNNIEWLYSHADIEEISGACNHCGKCERCALKVRAEAAMLPGTYVYSNHLDVWDEKAEAVSTDSVDIIGVLDLDSCVINLYEHFRQAVDTAKMILARGEGISANEWLDLLWETRNTATIRRLKSPVTKAVCTACRYTRCCAFAFEDKDSIYKLIGSECAKHIEAAQHLLRYYDNEENTKMLKIWSRNS